jgi:alkylation response protein AidB-like acyl-CoA dehydrogenase
VYPYGAIVRTTRTEALTVATVDDQADRLAADAERRIEELDALGRLPADLAEAAAAAGLFRQLVPSDLGGWDGTPLEWFRRGVRIARVEAAFAWVVTQGSAELAWIAAGGDVGWAAHVLADPLASSASTVAGLGVLRVDGASATVRGSWSFDTGCHAATWIGGLTLVDGEGGSDGGPAFRMSWVPADRAEVHDDWDAAGLRGSGSASVEIPEQQIPLAWTVPIFEPTSNDRGRYRVLVGNGNWPIAGSVAATLLGIARRALDEAAAIVRSKAPAPSFTPMSSDPGVLRRLGALEGRWAAATALVEAELHALWDDAVAGSLTYGRRLAVATACAHARIAALEVIDAVTDLTGTAAVNRRSVLSRCIRDAQTLRGHISTGSSVLERVGRIHLGLGEPDFLI